MFQYILRRLLMAIPVLFGILVVTFVLGRLIPGDPCKAILGEKATALVCERFIHDHGLDKPIYVQLGLYMRDVLRGDFGNSIRFSRPVSIILIERLPLTIELGMMALLLATALGIPLGIISAEHSSSCPTGRCNTQTRRYSPCGWDWTHQCRLPRRRPRRWRRSQTRRGT